MVDVLNILLAHRRLPPIPFAIARNEVSNGALGLIRLGLGEQESEEEVERLRQEFLEVYIQNKPTCNSWNGGRAVIGIQNINGTSGFTPPNRNTGSWSAQNEAWRFTPDGIPIYTINWFENGINIG